MSDETPEAQRLSDFAWLRATNGGEAQGYPPIVRRLLAAYDEQVAALKATKAELKASIGRTVDACCNADDAVQQLIRERDAALARAVSLDEALTLLEDWLVTMHHVPAEHLHTAIQQHNAKVCALLTRARANTSTPA